MPPKPATDPGAPGDIGESEPPMSPAQAQPCQQQTPHPASDEALMADLAGGKDSALNTLMARWELPLKSFLLRLGIPRCDVEDIAQEAFVRLYHKRASYRTGARFKPWLLTLAANLGRNRLRWRLRRREDSIDALLTAASFASDAPATPQPPRAGDITDASAPCASRQAELNERYAAVRQAVQRLPEKLRQAVVCVDLESLSYAEAAAVLRCTVKAVESRLQRGRQMLRVQCATFLTRD